MKTTLTTLVLAISASLFAPAQAMEPSETTPLWSVSGFKMPESVEFDKTRQRYYVSNINQGVMSHDNNGSIGVINHDGQVINYEWIKGLHSPKGLALNGKLLYVADIGELTVIDVEKGEIIARHAAPESKVLNGITISPKGDVFVSDWFGNAIYRLHNGVFEKWLDTTNLNTPNGLWATEDSLYVASWGANPKQDFSTDTTGRLLKISLKTKQITALDQGDAFFNMDGLTKLSDNEWLMSDFMQGKVFSIKQDGNKITSATQLIQAKPGSADFFYQASEGLIVLPNVMNGTVAAYRQ